MTDIVIEEGGIYKLRNGAIVGPMRPGSNSTYPWVARDKDGGIIMIWTTDGKYDIYTTLSILDIVECIEKPQPDYVVTEPTVTLFSEIPLNVYRENIAKSFDRDRLHD